VKTQKRNNNKGGGARFLRVKEESAGRHLKTMKKRDVGKDRHPSTKNGESR